MTPVPKAKWQQVCADCAGGIDSLVELLQGRFSKGVLDRLCRQGDGLFPVPKDIHFDCSCPDGAYLCKHVAAVLYGKAPFDLIDWSGDRKLLERIVDLYHLPPKAPVPAH